MTDRLWSRRGVLCSVGGAGTLAIAGATRGMGRMGTQRTSSGGRSCTPGHTDGDPPCKQIRNDRDVRIRFDGADTALLTSFEYPCGWTTRTNRVDGRVQANVTRSEIGEANAYVDVQVRNYDEPVEEGFLDQKREEGNYDDVEYQYDGRARIGLVSAADTAQYGTTAHAVVPSHWRDALVHVELISTLKGADCPQPQPDYLLVKRMLASLEPNWAATTVTLSDQRVSDDVGTQAVTVDSVTLPRGGYVAISTATASEGITADSIVGASPYLEAGQHENVRVALETTLEESRSVTAVLHRDTDGDNVYGFDGSAGVDGPYLGVDSAAVTDEASVQVGAPPTPSPPPTRSPTAEPTTTAASTRASSTATPSRTATGDAAPTGGDGSGFGVGATLGGTALASALFRWRQAEVDGE